MKAFKDWRVLFDPDMVRALVLVRYRGRVGTITLIAAFIFSVMFLFFCTPLYFGDAPHYLAGARSLVFQGTVLDANGHRMVHWLPFLSMLYTPVYLFRIPLNLWAWAVNGSMMGLFLWWTYRTLCIVLKDRFWAGLIASGSLFWLPLFSQFVYFQTEPVYAALLAGAFYSFARLESNFEWHWFYIFALFGSFMMLTRYSGIFSIMALAYGFFFFLNKPIKQRFWMSVTYLGLVCSGFVVWLIRNSMTLDSTVERSLFFERPSLDSLSYQAYHLISFLTGSENFIVGSFLGISIVFIFARFFLLKKSDEIHLARHIVVVLLVSAAIYIAGIVATHYVLDLTTTITTRLISPALYAIFLATAISAYWCVRMRSRSIWKKINSVAIIVCVIAFFEGASYIDNFFRQVTLYQHQQLRLDEFRKVDFLSYGSPLYSNNDEFMSFVLNRTVPFTPHKFSRYHLTSNPRYEIEVTDMLRSIRNSGAIIYLGKPFYENYQMPIDDILRIPELQVVYTNGPATIFTYKK